MINSIMVKPRRLVMRLAFAKAKMRFQLQLLSDEIG